MGGVSFAEQGVCPRGPESRRDAANAQAESVAQLPMEQPSHPCCVTSQFQNYTLTPEAFAAEETDQLYTCRWQVALVFKEFNSHYLLDELPAHRAPVVEALTLSCIMMVPVRHGLLVACATADWNGSGIGCAKGDRHR